MNGFETILPFLKPIEHLILDDSISEVMVNGPNAVFVEKNGVLEHATDVSLSDKALMVAVKNIARRLGDDISEAKPVLDSRLPDGSRVAAVIRHRGFNRCGDSRSVSGSPAGTICARAQECPAERWDRLG